MEKKAVELKNEKVDYEAGKLVVSGDLVHSSEFVDVELTLKVSANAGPVVDKILDVVGEKIDALIPGDQSALIAGIKASVKEALEKV